MTDLYPPGNPTATWPLGKRLTLYLNKSLRRSHRLFKAFPGIAYRNILDVGAYRGEFTDSVLGYFEPERVWLVEAHPEWAAQLRQKYAATPACTVIHAALAQTSGPVEFRVNQHAPSSSLLPISPVSAAAFAKEMSEVQSLRVPALSLDDLFEQAQIAAVDLMKVDIQGAERLLIRGGARALQKVRLIYIEVLFAECYQGCALFCELHELLQGAGFKLRSLHDFRRGSDGTLVYANGLYGRTR